MFQHLRALVQAKAVPRSMPKLLDALHPSDAGGQLWAEQPGVSCLVCQPPNSGELLIDRVGSQSPPFQKHAVANHDDAIESQAGLRAVPGNELLDGVLVDAAGTRRSETVQYRQFGVIQVWQPKHGTTIVRLGLAFSHNWRPPLPQHGITALSAVQRNRSQAESELSSLLFLSAGQARDAAWLLWVESKTRMAKRQSKSKATWVDVKAKLAGYDRAALLGVVQDLYAAQKDNQAFLHARLGLSANALEPYKRTIDRWLWPDVFRRQ